MPMLVGAHKVPHRRTGRRKSSMHGEYQACIEDGRMGWREGGSEERDAETERDRKRNRERQTKIHTHRKTG